MSQDICASIDNLGQRFDSGIQVLCQTIDKAVAQMARSYPPVSSGGQVSSRSDEQVQHHSSHEELSALNQVRSKLNTVKDAFRPCTTEVELALRKGRIDDISYEAIRIAWHSCRDDFLPGLRSEVTKLEQVIAQEHLSKLNDLSTQLTNIIDGNNRGAIPVAVTNFGSTIQVCIAEIDGHFNRLLDTPGSAGEQPQ
jgi:hypothetical protein